MAKHLNVNLQFTADTGQAKAQIQSLQQSLTQLSTTNIGGKGMTGYTQEVGKAISKVNELKSILASSTNAAGGLDLGKFNQSLKQAGTSIDSYRQHLSKLGPEGKQAFAQLAQSISTASVPIKQTSGLLTEMATTLKNTARWQLTSSLIHGFMGSLQSAMSYAQGLDKSLTNIRIVTGMSSDEMESFATRANKAAQALSTSTKAYSDAALIYYQQGLGDKEVAEKTDVTVKMANVTGDAAADVSSYLTAIWNNFNKDGTQAAEHYADIMTKLGAETAASTSEIASGLSKFSAVADTIGLSFEMASSTVTAIVDQTREAPEVVGTALKTIFSRVEGLKMGETLDDGTDLNKYSEGLAKVGVDIKDASGNLRDMDSILHDIGDTWETLSKDEQVALAQTVAGVRQYNQFIAMFDNWDKVEENLERAADAGGTLEEQAEIYAESWEGARNRVKAAMEDIWGKVIDDDFFIGLNNFLADFLGVISEVIDSLGGMKGVLLLLSTAMMNLFGKSMAASIDRFAYNIHLTSKKGQQEVADLRAKTTAAMSQMAKEMGNSISGQAMAKTFAGTASLQEKIIEQTKKIAAAGREVSTEEQEFFNAVLQTNQALSEQYVAIQKNREALADQVKTEQNADKRNMTAAAAGNADRKNMLKTNQRRYDVISSGMEKNINTSALGMDLHSQLKQQMAGGASQDAMKQYVQGYIDQIKNQAIPVTNEFKQMLNKLAVGEINDVELEELRAKMGLCEERAGELQGKLQQLYERSGSTNNPQKKAEDAAKGMTNLANKTKDAVNAGLGLDQNIKTSAKDLDELNNKPFTLGQKITAVSGALSAVAMTITSINGMIDTLKDPDATGWQKFSAVLMTVGMTLPMLTSAFSLNNMQMIAGASASIAQALGFQAAGASAFAATGEVAAFGATLWSVLWPIGLVMAAIAALVGIFVLLHRQAHKAEREFKKASETADTMNKRYEDSKTALEEVNGELDTLAEKRKALGELTKGTEEWNKALEDSNNYVLDLIDKYPELAQYVYTDENGALAISEAGQNKLIERKEQEVEDAQIAKTSANIDKNEAEIEYNKDEIQGQIRGNTGARGQTQEISDAQYEEVLKLASEYGTDIPEDLLMEAVGNNQSLYNSVIENLPEIVTMLSKNNALQEANNVQAKELGKSIMEKTGVELTDKQKEDYKGLEGALADEYDRVYEDEKDTLSGYSKKGIIDQYLAQNSDLTLLDKNGGKGKAAIFKDANGNEVKMTVDEMIDAIAANNAMDKVADKWDDVADRLLEVNKNSPLAKEMAGEEEGGLSGNLGQAVFSVNQNGEFDLSSLSSGDISRLAEKEDVTAEDLGLDDTTAKEYGFTTGQEMADAFMQQIRDQADLDDHQDDKSESGAIRSLTQDDDHSNFSDEEVEANNKTFSNYKDRGDGLVWDQDEAFSSRSKAGYYSKDERSDILADAGVDDTYFNDQKTEISKNMSSREATWNEETNQVEMGESKTYDELKDSYDKYQQAVKDGNDELAKQYEDEAKQFRKTENQLNDLAAAQTEMNDGAGELVDNWDAWSSAIEEGKEGTEEYANAIDSMKDSTAKMLNIDADSLSDGFITENLEDIEAAANGDVEAMNRLRAAFAEEYAANVELNGVAEEDIEQVRNQLNETLTGLASEIDDLEIGATLDDSEYINTLNEMLANGQLTEEQVNEALSGMGYEPQIESVPAKLFTGGWPKNPIPVDIFGVDLGEIPAGLIPEINLPIKVPQITGGNKKTNKTTPITSGGGGGGGGGGGSPRGGSRPRGRTRERQRGEYKKLKNEKERYHEINNQLEDMEHKLNMIEKAKDRAFGKNKLKLMNQEQAALKKQIELQKKYQAEIKTNLNNDRKKVADLGAKFDKNGTITNYDEMIADATKDYNAKMKDFENLSASKQDELDEKYKRLTNPETGNKYSGYKDYLEAEYNKVKDAIDQYEETQDLAKDVEEQIQDSLNELYDLELEEVDYKVQLKLEVNEDDQKIIDFLMDRIDGDSWRTAEEIELHERNIVNSQENIDTAKSGLEGIFANHENIDSAAVMDALNSGDYEGAMTLLGDEQFTEAEIEKIKEYSNTILDETANIKDEQMAVVDSMNDVFDTHMEHFDQYGQTISHTGDVLSAYGEIIDLVGQEEMGISAETMQKMRDTSIELLESANKNAKNKFDQAKAEYDYAEQQLAAARETGDKELIRHWEDVVQHTKEGMQDAESEWMSSWTELLQAARDKFDDEMQESIRNFEKAVAGSAGSLEGLSAQMDLYAMVDDNHVEDYERIYELNKLNREIENSIDNTSNVRAKEALLELEDKILQKKESGEAMSEHEIEMLRKQYELKMAEIALEEAQNSKSQVRMTKDAEGNFSYVYTADDNAVEDAEQNYEDKLKEYQELNHNYIKELESQLVDTQKNYAQAMAAAAEMYGYGTDEYTQAVALIQQKYQEEMSFLHGELQMTMDDNKRLHTEDVASYAQNVGDTQLLNVDYIGSFDQTTYALATGYTSRTAAEQAWQTASAAVMSAADASMQAYQTTVSNAMEANTGVTSSFGEAVSSTITSISDVSSTLASNVSSTLQDVTSHWAETSSAVSSFAEMYNNTLSTLIESNETFVETVGKVTSAWAEVEEETTSTTTKATTPTTSGGGGGGGGNNNRPTGSRLVGRKVKLKSNARLATSSDRSARLNTPYRGRNVYVQRYIRGRTSPYHVGISTNFNNSSSWVGWLDIKQIEGYRTGGYTGKWNNTDGRLAMLHQKEIVLNAHDTENFLKTVDIVRQIAQTIDLNALASSGGIGQGLHSAGVNSHSQDLQQQVHITAEFPNATDKNEIIKAFDNVINLAAQYANKKR